MPNYRIYPSDSPAEFDQKLIAQPNLDSVRAFGLFPPFPRPSILPMPTLQWSNCVGFDLGKIDVSGLQSDDVFANVYVSDEECSPTPEHVFWSPARFSRVSCDCRRLWLSVVRFLAQTFPPVHNTRSESSGCRSLLPLPPWMIKRGIRLGAPSKSARPACGSFAIRVRGLAIA